MYHHIRGVGLYMRKLATRIHGSPKNAAKRASDNGLSFVLILGCWQEVSRRGVFSQRLINTPEDIWRYAEAFKEVGIETFVWGYPWYGHERQFADAMAATYHHDLIRGPVPDPELGMKPKGANRRRPQDNMRGTAEAISVPSPKATEAELVEAGDRLMGYLIDDMNESQDVIVTSYGRPKYHKGFPWEVFTAYGYKSPQFYDFTYLELEAGFDEWFERSPDYGEPGVDDTDALLVIPSFSLYGPRSGVHLNEYFVDLVSCRYKIPAVIGWSWVQTSRMEWKTLASWADRDWPLEFDLI